MSQSSYYIEVSKKPGLLDGRSAGLIDSVKDLGVQGVEGFGVSALYILKGELTEETVQRICKDLLGDPVAEQVRIGQGRLPSFDGNLTIEVTYHPGVTDTVAETVATALDQIGIGGIESIATGMVYHLYCQAELDVDTIRLICERILANPVIQNYEVYDPQGSLVLKG